uniref:Uncharacterized protein n=1 Tax=Picea sitchensis TaxID=3332 RepID=A9NM03_PICSI|nr:unknown [Picea sitchensis]
MGMSYGYGPPKPDEEMISLIRHAVISKGTFETKRLFSTLRRFTALSPTKS